MSPTGGRHRFVSGLGLLLIILGALGCLEDGRTCVGDACEQADTHVADSGTPDGGLPDRPEDRGGNGSGADGGADAGADGGGDAGSNDVDHPDVIEEPPDEPSASPRLEALRRVALPYATVGQAVGSAELEVWETAGAAFAEALVVDVEGPFAIEGSLAPLLANETRVLTVSYTGVGAAGVTTGSATIRAGPEQVVSALAVAIGRADLGAVAWDEDAYGSRGTVSLATAPFPHTSAGYTDATVVVAVPPGLSGNAEVDFTVHFHGHYATVEETVAAQYLVELHALSGRDSVFLAPQGPLEAADGNFGKLTEANGLEALLEDVATLLYRDGFVSWPVVGEAVLTSHSGGYIGVASAAQVGGVPIRAIQLYDSLYALGGSYLALIQSGVSFRSNYTAGGGTEDDNLQLLGMLEGAGITAGTADSDEALAALDVIIARTSASHGDCMYAQRTAARWEAQSGLRRRPSAPPELLLTEASGDRARVEWRADRGDAGTIYRIEGSENGSSWEGLAQTAGTSAEVAARPWIRVVATSEALGDSAPSDVYGVSGAEWLVVDGFDRVLRGSYAEPTHPFAAWVAQGLASGYSIASNEAVVEGRVSLSDYAHVLWLLGDESLADVTFDADERSLVEDYLDGGGQLIVSGSELGFATSPTWLSSVLHVTYVADDANTTTAGGFDFGVAYPEDYPDVFSGQSVIWSYATGGAAAVGWDGRVIAVGFPLETLAVADRDEAIGQLVDWLE